MNAIFISTHYDDVVWSAGGRIHLFKTAGYSVKVITIFTQYAADELQRECENARAIDYLGVEHIPLGFKEALLRKSKGSSLYLNEKSLFSELRSCENNLPDTISNSLQSIIDDNDVINIPIGNAKHVDHKVALLACKELKNRNILYYEEFPYSRTPSDKKQYCHSIKVNKKIWLQSAYCYESQIKYFFKQQNIFELMLERFTKSNIHLTTHEFCDHIWSDTGEFPLSGDFNYAVS